LSNPVKRSIDHIAAKNNKLDEDSFINGRISINHSALNMPVRSSVKQEPSEKIEQKLHTMSDEGLSIEDDDGDDDGEDENGGRSDDDEVLQWSEDNDEDEKDQNLKKNTGEENKKEMKPDDSQMDGA